MQMTTDKAIVFVLGRLEVNATIVNTWIVMALLVGISLLITRHLRADVPPTAGALRWR